jgi:hypothetical protein
MDLARTLATLAVLAVPAFTGTITVGPTGSGAQFDDIADAITAALPGDTILIEPGQYVDATPLVVDKPLTVIGHGPANTSFQAVAQNPFDQPLPLLVTGLSAGEEVRIAGLGLSSLSLLGTPATAVVVLDCEGPVVLSDLANILPLPNSPTPGLVQVRNSTRVTLDGCAFDAGSSLEATTPALLVEDSKVYVNNCTLRGGKPGTGFITLPDDGGDALVAIGSEVRVSLSSLIGAAGTTSSSLSMGQVATDGGSAIVATDSLVFVRGGWGHKLRGGNGGLLQVGGTQLVGAAGLCIEHDATSVVSTTSDVFLLNGVDGLGQPPASPVAGSGTWIQVPTPLASLAAAFNVVGLGGTASVDHSGQPGALVLPYFALVQAPALTIPGIFGEIYLDPAKAVPLKPAGISALGFITSQAKIPVVPSMVGLTFLVQAFQVNPGGEASISALTMIAIH